MYDVWAGAMLHPSVSGSFQSDAFGGHDSRFYVLTPRKVAAVPPATPEVAATPMQCEARCAGGGAAGTNQPSFHHCCVGLNSTGQTPSCAMGCLFGKHTASLTDCQATCHQAHGQCSYRSAATANATLNLCGSCASGAAGDCSYFATGRWGNLNATSCRCGWPIAPTDTRCSAAA